MSAAEERDPVEALRSVADLLGYDLVERPEPPMSEPDRVHGQCVAVSYIGRHTGLERIAYRGLVDSGRPAGLWKCGYGEEAVPWAEVLAKGAGHHVVYPLTDRTDVRQPGEPAVDGDEVIVDRDRDRWERQESGLYKMHLSVERSFQYVIDYYGPLVLG